MKWIEILRNGNYAFYEMNFFGIKDDKKEAENI